MKKLSILICTIKGREQSFNALIAELKAQDILNQCEILSICDNKELTIGAKRQKLLDIATGEFITFIDDDDWIAADYVQRITDAIQPGIDSIGFLQKCTMKYPDHTRESIAHLSNRWDSWKDNEGGYSYVRTPYHKTPMRREIAHAIGFNTDMRFGEDHDFSKRLKESGLIKKEAFIPHIMYLYQYEYSEHKERYNIDWQMPSPTFAIPYLAIEHTKEMDILKVTHNAGFFSCCTIRLMDIVNYYNTHGELPDAVDSSAQLANYKAGNENLWEQLFNTSSETKDNLSFLPTGPIDITTDTKRELQFSDYKQIINSYTTPLMRKYFMVSDMVMNIYLKAVNDKYNLGVNFEPLNNICAVFYRGNDKNSETTIASYQEFINKAKEIQVKEPNIRFLVQPDETEFLHAFKAEFPDAIHFEECHHMPKKNSCIMYELPAHERPKHAANFLASVLIMSNAKHLITHSGNGGLFSVLFRGHGNNVHQYLNGEWI